MRTSREEWAKRVEQWKDSGLTAREFARELGLNPRSLAFWKWQLGRADLRRAGGRSASWGTRGHKSVVGHASEHLGLGRDRRACGAGDELVLATVGAREQSEAARGYPHVHLDVGTGAGHVDGALVRATLPDALLWTWRGYVGGS